MPNLLDIGVVPGWVVHLGFRAYSMMVTTTIIGLLVGYLYRPKSWCVICPMGTLSSLALRNQKTVIPENFSQLEAEQIPISKV